MVDQRTGLKNATLMWLNPFAFWRASGNGSLKQVLSSRNSRNPSVCHVTAGIIGLRYSLADDWTFEWPKGPLWVHLRRFWHVHDMSVQGIIPECTVVRI